MLKNWSVENFKSVKNRIELDLAPITIFAGANSSGKSTILHSILLAKQTIRYAPHATSLALNGPILKLGFYQEVKNSAAENDFIGFGCRFEFAPVADPSDAPDNMVVSDIEYSSISLDAKFSSKGTDDLSKLHPTLRYSRLTAIYPQPEDFENWEFEEGLAPDVQRDFNIVIDAPAESGIPDDTGPATIRQHGSRPRPLFHVAALDADTIETVCEGKSKAKIIGARAQHFFPADIVVQYDENQTRATQTVTRLCSLSPSPRMRYDTQERVHMEVVDYIAKYLEDHGFLRAAQKSLFKTDDVEKTISLWEAISFIREDFRYPNPDEGAPSRPHIRSPQQTALRAALQDIELQQHLIMMIANKYGPKISNATERTNEQENALSYISAFLSNRTKYIGPLRDEPKPLYPLEEVADPTDVGYRGEHTAAVLELNQWTWISYIPPTSLSLGRKNAKPEGKFLIGAVTAWLEYLGVATKVLTSDMGKFGHQMQVQTDASGSAPHDLTNVGVGVSQVLPIVVMALLAPSDSLLIFEQPELHLHPRVQSRLADFFLSMAYVGKQCLLETHSEYLIQRLRRRIAEDEVDDLRGQIQAYFVERINGASSYKPVEFTEYGAIADWPADFFDQSDREVEQISLSPHQRNVRKK